MTTLPILHVAICPIARTAVLVAPPIRYTTMHGMTPPATEADIIVTLTGALGTHYMIWRESPAAWDGPPSTAIHHVEPSDAGDLVLELIDQCDVPRDRLIDSIALVRLIIDSAAALGAPSGSIAAQIESTIVSTCRMACAPSGDPDGLSPADRRVAERIANLPIVDPAPGWEERVLDAIRTGQP